AVMNARAQVLQNKYFENNISQITVSKSGLWLKQYDPADGTETLVTAASISPDSKDFRDLIIFEFNKNYQLKRRIDAAQGKLEANRWLFKDVIINLPLSIPQRFPELEIPTNLTLAQIQDSFSSPDSMSFWQLPEFIDVLEKSGFSALRHKLYFHTL